MRSAFLFATYAEAKSAVDTFQAVQEGPSIFSLREHKIIITGMGPLDASAAVTAIPLGYRWINLGIVGSFDPSIPVGHIVHIGTTAFLEDDKAYDHCILDPSHLAVLYTSSSPVYKRPLSIDPSGYVDMEGHAIAKVARKRGIPCSIVKVVSDFCNQDSHEDIAARLDDMSGRLVQVVRQFAMP